MSEAKRIDPIKRGCITGLSPYGSCVCCGAEVRREWSAACSAPSPAMGDAGGSQKGTGRMSRKYIRYDKPEVYGIIYKSERVIYYNIGFVGQTKLFILCP